MSLTTEQCAQVVERLDQQHIEDVAGSVRACIHGWPRQPVEACYQPGDGTWYSLVFVPLYAVVGGTGGGTAGRGPSHYLGRGTLVVYQQACEHGRGGSFVIPDDGIEGDLDHYEWLVNEKVDWTTPASAYAIALLLDKVFAQSDSQG